MPAPIIYYDNLFPTGVLSGSNTDEAFPVRRIADADLTLPYVVASGAGVLEGEVSTTTASGETRDYFVLAKGANLSGFVFTVISEDVGGGGSAEHAQATATSDTPFVLTLSGVVTPRRVWRVTVSGTTSGLGNPTINEAMLASRLVLARRPQIGVQRTIRLQADRIEIPGGAPWRLRLGNELDQVDYQMVLVSGAEIDAVTDFLRVNDGGEPFWFVDDRGESFWAEAPGREFGFDDQAGVHFFGLTVLEVPDE